MKDNQPIHVMIVDDHTMVRCDLELTGEAATGETAVKFYASFHPDIILMDMVIPGMDGAAVLRAIREQFPAIQVIALTNLRTEGFVTEAGALAVRQRFTNYSAEAVHREKRGARQDVLLYSQGSVPR